MNRDIRNQLFISLFFIISLILETLNWNLIAGEMKPSLLLLTFIYWNLALPNKVGLGSIFIFGILLDLIDGNMLGINSLILLTASYLSQRFFYQFRVMHLFQQSIGIIFMSLLANLIFFIGSFIEQDNLLFLEGSFYFYNLLANGFLNGAIWPLVFYISRYYRRKLIVLDRA